MAALSKKQQKAAAFRAKHKAKVEAIPDVPEADVAEDAEVEEEAVAPEPEGKRKRKRDDADEDEDEGEHKAEKKDKKKGKESTVDKKEDQPKAKRTKESKQRFILFIGFKTTREDVAAHFAKDLGRTPSVRLLTERATGKQPPKSRGIAFLELASSEELQTCLKQHHTQLHGRRINVELTAGGGGKSDARRTKLAERNKRIGDQREKRAEREKEAGGEDVKEDDKIGQGRQGWGEEVEVEAGVGVAAADGVKMRGGRRVKKKAPEENKQMSGWAARHASGASAPRGGFRKKWEPTGANAVSVG